jgi:hypothetical protein
MGSTPVLEIPYPDGTDSADGPGALQAIAERIEALGLYTETDVSATRQPDGRWLLCDVERDMTTAEIVAECPGLRSGDADLLATLLGTGTSSLYGDAAGGKVKIPGYAGKFAIHPSASHPRKGTGSSGGEESHVLTAGEAALKAHGHGVTDPGHVHSASQAVHSHGVAISDPGHGHGVLVNTNLNRFATQQGSGATIQPYGDAGTVVGKGGAGNTGADTTGVSASADNQQPAVTVDAHATGLAVDNAAGVNASQAHNNLPPYRAGGHRFMYV